MTALNSSGLVPLQGCVLVELAGNYQFVVTPDERYKTTVSGRVIDGADDIKPKLASFIGKTVFWEEYKDNVKTARNGHEYAFIKLEDIRGYDAN